MDMKKLFVLGVIVMILIGCGGGASSVDKAINQVDKAVAKIEKKKGNLTEEDWRSIEKEVEEPLKVMTEALDNDKVGALTKLKIIAATAKWATTVAQSGLGEIMEKRTNEFAKELENATKELEKIVPESESDSSPGTDE